ncbi:MAG: alpha-hydroxy-acid oxidizing protein [Thiobacillaceae bacterium]|nr:alpha-hydroxy-acid oxidizing protein [Thiobacillaceae bacterium]
MSNQHMPLPEVRAAADYEALAHLRLHPEAWDYLSQGAGTGRTLAANRRAFEQAVLVPRVLADVRGGHTRVTLFGQPLAHPILLAPLAYQRWFHPHGEQAGVLAAACQGTLAVVSSLASQPLEDIAAVVQTGQPRPWFQLYWLGEREPTAQLLARAEAAGYGAVVFTVDVPVKSASARLPAGVDAVNLPHPIAAAAIPEGGSAVFDGWMTRAPTWDDLVWLRAHTRLPLLIKGVLHPDDAERALDCGADGVIVSNHGGRSLDGAPASLDALPLVVARLAGRAPILFDGGIRSGADVLVALTRGADAVLIGRPYVWGLAVAGAMGAAHVLRLLRDELELAMALTGRRHLQA